MQLASALGARVIATTSNPSKIEALRELGADEVIDYKADPAWGETARALTKGRGVDRVVEVGGPTSLAQSFKAVALGGQVSLLGVLGGFEGGLDVMSLFMSQASLKPIPTGSRQDLEDMLRVMAQHRLHPVIDSFFAFEDAPAAFAHYGERQVFGKVVIRH